MNLYIKAGSITNAQRGVKILNKNGYKAQIKRIEKPTAADGCGYVIFLKADNNEPVSILERNGISVKGAESR